MTSSTRESFKVEINKLEERLKQLVQEGNVRRIIVRREDRVIAEFPLTFAIVGALLAPVVAAIGAIAALVSDCTIEVERIDDVGREATTEAEAAPPEESSGLSA